MAITITPSTKTTSSAVEGSRPDASGRPQASTATQNVSTQVAHSTRDKFLSILARKEEEQKKGSFEKQTNSQLNPSKMPQDAKVEVQGSQEATQSSQEAPEAIKAKPEAIESDPRIEELTKREKAAWAEVRKLKAEREAEKAKAALAPEEKKAEPKRMTQEEWLRTFQQDPTSLGLSYDQLGQMYLQKDAPKDPMIQAFQEEIRALREELGAVKTTQETSSQQAYQEALKQIDYEAKTLVDTDPSYEVTRSQGAHEAITSLIELTYQETGVLMTTREAANQIEAELEAQYLEVFNKSNKLKAKIQPKQGDAAQASPEKTPTTSQTQRTLTREVANTSPRLSSRERAMLAFQGKLK